jgi:hypothetical protein
VLISSTLDKILSVKSSPSDISFYIEQMKLLLHRAHAELIPGNQAFQNKYNLWLLDGYLRMLLETLDMKLIAQLLDLDSILYSLEDAERENGAIGINAFIDFDIPNEVNPVRFSDDITYPITDELSAYLHSFNKNLLLLARFISKNKDGFGSIYKRIINTAAKRFG